MLVNILISVGFLIACGVILAALLILAEKKILNFGICKIDINKGNKVLEVPGGSPLLFSLSENGIFIPSACGGRGSCAYCKLKVHKGGGMVTPIEKPYLSDEELAGNVRLSCQVKVRNDMDIEIPEELFRVKRFKGVVEHKKTLTHDIQEVRIKLIEPDTIDFVAGQYVQLESEEYKGRDSVMRAYSMSSIPDDKHAVEMNIRLVPEGICTTWVFEHMKEGDEVYLSGPYGEFHLSDTDAPALFIAGGSGMAPIWSILRDLKARGGTSRKMMYFFGALTQKDLFYVDELKALENEFDDFTFVPALSNEPDDSDWKGDRGLITDVLDRHVPDTSACEAYLCGSPGMIDASVKVLTKNGLKEENIFYDKFA